MLKRESISEYKFDGLSWIGVIIVFAIVFTSDWPLDPDAIKIITGTALVALLLMAADVLIWVAKNMRGIDTLLGNITLVRGWWPRIRANVSAEELKKSIERYASLEADRDTFEIRRQAKDALVSLMRKQYVELAIGVQTVIERIGKPECNTPARIKRELEAVLERMKTVATFACLSELEGEEPELPTTMRQNWLTFLAKRAGIRLDEDRARHEKKAKAKESTQN